MTLQAGAKLGPYEILGPIGKGGMGEVYQADDPRLGRKVAIKVATAQFSERSAREARLVAALNHPNICHIYDVGSDFLVMELVEGPTLAERLEQGPVPLDEALGIARQISEALDSAHLKGIVHRDLKPGNIKLRPDGTVKVLDFGLAKAFEEASAIGDPENSPTLTLEQATRTGTVIGTAAYMAPEQARGKPVDKRADIWAFGVVLYEMLTGQRLFEGESVSDTLAAVLTKEPDWKGVPPRAERLLRRCLQRDPQQRLRDIGEARFLLEEDPKQTVRTSRSNLAWKISMVALAFVLAITMASLWVLTRPPAPAVFRLSVDLGDDAALNPQRGAAMALSPDNSRIVFVIGEPTLKGRLAVRRLDQQQSVPLAGTETAEAPFFSPDGKFIAFFADGKLKKVETGGGAPVTLCDAPSQRGGSWGEDDNIVFAPTNRGGLFRVPSSGGTPQGVTDLDKKRGENSHRYPQVLPGAKAVVFMTGISSAGEGTIEAQSFKTGVRRTLVQTGAYPRYLPSGHLVYVHRSTLFAAPMDLSRLELTGPSMPWLDDVSFEAGTGTSAFAFSQSGLFVYAAANSEDRMRPIAMLDEKGRAELLPVAKAAYIHPRVSPDGTRLAITVAESGAAHIWIYEWATQRLSRFPFLNGNSENAVWTPDGKYLVFSSDAQNPGPGIYCMRADGTGAPERLVEGSDLIPRSLSPQATQLAYTVQRGPKAGLWMLSVDWSDSAHPRPGKAERLMDDFPAGGVAFSPEGRWIAYVTNMSGTPEVFVRPFPGPGGPWQVSNGGDHPVWSRTGHELFYQGIPDYETWVSSYSVAGGSFSPARPHRWNNTRVDLNSFDLMPDGKRVVAVPAAGQKETTHATFLMNFVDDLRRRLPARK